MKNLGSPMNVSPMKSSGSPMNVSPMKNRLEDFYCKLAERPGVASGKKEIILKNKIEKNFDFLAYNTPGHLKTMLDQYETYM